jgi:hypothetical protein
MDGEATQPFDGVALKGFAHVTAHPIMYQPSSPKLRHAQLGQNAPLQLG